MQRRTKLSLLGTITAGLGIATAFGLLTFSQNTAISSSAKEKPTPIQRRSHAGLATGWKPYHTQIAQTLEHWRPQSSKVIFELQNGHESYAYVVAIKQAKAKRKDHLWEFPGGRVEHGEPPLAALLRELKEEDPSQVLSQVFQEALDDHASKLSYRMIVLPNRERHLLFKTMMPQETWERLAEYWQKNNFHKDEVYSFQTLSLEQLDISDRHIIEKWTPKSRKILLALRAGL